MAIYLAHWSGNKSHFDGGSAGRTIHMWLGYLTLLLVAFQVVIGLRKYMIKVLHRCSEQKANNLTFENSQARDGVSWAKWHGVIGPFIYLFGTITLCWGIGIFYIADEKKPQSQVNAGIGVMVSHCASTRRLRVASDLSYAFSGSCHSYICSRHRARVHGKPKGS